MNRTFCNMKLHCLSSRILINVLKLPCVSCSEVKDKMKVISIHKTDGLHNNFRRFIWNKYEESLTSKLISLISREKIFPNRRNPICGNAVFVPFPQDYHVFIWLLFVDPKLWNVFLKELFLCYSNYLSFICSLEMNYKLISWLDLGSLQCR